MDAPHKLPSSWMRGNIAMQRSAWRALTHTHPGKWHYYKNDIFRIFHGCRWTNNHIIVWLQVELIKIPIHIGESDQSVVECCSPPRAMGLAALCRAHPFPLAGFLLPPSPLQQYLRHPFTTLCDSPLHPALSPHPHLPVCDVIFI